MIRLASDDITSDPVAINNAFVDYHSKLCSSETSCVWDGPNPLDSLTYPKITPAVASDLGVPITVTKVKDAICSQDLFCNTCQRLVQVFNYARTKGLLPTTMSEASISLLLKKTKTLTSAVVIDLSLS